MRARRARRRPATTSSSAARRGRTAPRATATSSAAPGCRRSRRSSPSSRRRSASSPPAGPPPARPRRSAGGPRRARTAVARSSPRGPARRRRQQPADASRVEVGQHDRPGRAQLVDEQARDQEAGDHEEDVDAEVAAAEWPHAGVEGHHEDDGDRAQPLDVGAERHLGGRLGPSGCGARAHLAAPGQRRRLGSGGGWWAEVAASGCRVGCGDRWWAEVAASGCRVGCGDRWWAEVAAVGCRVGCGDRWWAEVAAAGRGVGCGDRWWAEVAAAGRGVGCGDGWWAEVAAAGRGVGCGDRWRAEVAAARQRVRRCRRGVRCQHRPGPPIRLPQGASLPSRAWCAPEIGGVHHGRRLCQRERGVGQPARPVPPPRLVPMSADVTTGRAAPAAVATPPLPLRPELRGASPYGAPQLDVPVRLNTNENSTTCLPRSSRRSWTPSQRRPTASTGTPTASSPRCARTWPATSGTSSARRRSGRATAATRCCSTSSRPSAARAGRALGFTPAYSMHPIICDRDRHRLGRRAARRAERRRAFDLHRRGTPPAAGRRARAGRRLPLLARTTRPGRRSASRSSRPSTSQPRRSSSSTRRTPSSPGPGTPSALTLLPGRERLVVTRTMSKAFALAGARLGYLAADPAVCDALRLVRLPYHLSSLTQAAARPRWATPRCCSRRSRRSRRSGTGSSRAAVARPAPGARATRTSCSSAGWPTSGRPGAGCSTRGVLVRDVGMPDHLRVTAGTPEETTTASSRRLEVCHPCSRDRCPTRSTDEAHRTGRARDQGVEGRRRAGPRRHRRGAVSTGVGVLRPHAREPGQARPARPRRSRPTGDVDVDAHHTVEDVAIVLGQALREALGDKVGIRRFGDALVPLDECLVQAAVDVSGRPYCVHTGEPEGQAYVVIGGSYVGSLTRHVFETLALTAGIALHVAGAVRPRPAPRRRGPVQGAGPGPARGRRAGPAGRAASRAPRAPCEQLPRAARRGRLLDYGFGNVRSAVRALERVGAEVQLTADHAIAVRACDGLVVPGVGAILRCPRRAQPPGDQIVERRLAGAAGPGICVAAAGDVRAVHRAGRRDVAGLAGGPGRRAAALRVGRHPWAGTPSSRRAPSSALGRHRGVRTGFCFAVLRR